MIVKSLIAFKALAKLLGVTTQTFLIKDRKLGRFIYYFTDASQYLETTPVVKLVVVNRGLFGFIKDRLKQFGIQYETGKLAGLSPDDCDVYHSLCSLDTISLVYGGQAFCIVHDSDLGDFLKDNDHPDIHVHSGFAFECKATGVPSGNGAYGIDWLKIAQLTQHRSDSSKLKLDDDTIARILAASEDLQQSQDITPVHA